MTQTSRLLSLPYEIRQLIYAHVFTKDYIVIPYPQQCRYSNQRRPSTIVFHHPDQGNMWVYGINSADLVWVVRHVPSSDFMAMLYDYDPPFRTSAIGPDRLGSEAYPWPLGAACQTLYAEVLPFVYGKRCSFAFADFRSLIIWLKRTDKELLAGVRAVKLEMHLRVNEPDMTVEQELDRIDGSGGGWSGPEGPDEEEIAAMSDVGFIDEADEPWFDALKMLQERCTGIRAFSLHAELCGPPLAASTGLGPSGRPTSRMSAELKAAFRTAARRVIDVAEGLIPTSEAPMSNDDPLTAASSTEIPATNGTASDTKQLSEKNGNISTDSVLAIELEAGSTGSQRRRQAVENTPPPSPPTLSSTTRKQKSLEARHVSITAVQGNPSARSTADWRCVGRRCYLGRDIEDRLDALEVLPTWQRKILKADVSDTPSQAIANQVQW